MSSDIARTEHCAECDAKTLHWVFSDSVACESCGRNRSLESESVRVEPAYCASCGEIEAVWTDPKHRECIQCGSVVYDDYETYIKVGEQIGGRYVDTENGDRS